MHSIIAFLCFIHIKIVGYECVAQRMLRNSTILKNKIEITKGSTDLNYRDADNWRSAASEHIGFPLLGSCAASFRSLMHIEVRLSVRVRRDIVVWRVRRRA